VLIYIPLSVALSAFSAACPAANREEGNREAAIVAYAKAASAYDAGDLGSTIVSAADSLREDGAFYPALLLYGKASYLLGDDEAAISNLALAVSASPRSGEAALWLARAYRANGDGAAAKRSCELVLSCYPSDAAALRLASRIALDDDDAGLATAFLDRAVEAAGEVGMAFLDRAAIRWAAGDRDGAIADLDAATSTLPVGSASSAAAESLRDSVRAARR